MITVPNQIPAEELEPLMEGVQNVVKFLGIRPEYEVLIGYTYQTDRALVEAVATCIRRLGAKPSLLVIEPPGANRPTPRVVIEAAKGVDYFVTIGAGPGPHTKDHYTLLFDHGVSVGLVSPDPHFYTTDEAKYPLELWFEIHNRLKWKICKNEVDPGPNVTFRVTDERGSDLSWKIKCPDNIGAFVGAEPLDAGWWGAAPRPRILARAGFYPLLTMGDLQYSGNGVLYVDSTNYFGETPEPLKLTFEGGYCTGIEGGDEGKKAWETVSKYPNGNRLREQAVGICPKSAGRMPKFDPDAPIPRVPIPQWSLGDFLVALGGDTGVGGVDPGYEHATNLFTSSRRATITVDGETILDRGRLLILDDPELRELAARYGDPDYLLSPAT